MPDFIVDDHDHVVTCSTLPGHWSIQARDGVHVQVSWNVASGGDSVSGVVRDRHSGQFFDFELVLLKQQHIMQPLQGIDVTLTLHLENKEVVLGCNVPISYNEFFNGPIGKWRQGSVVPVDPDEPGIDDGTIIDAPQDAMDLFPFVWMHPPTQRELLDTVLRFLRYAAADTLPLCVTLAGCSGSGATAEKQKAAQDFRATPAFVKDVSALPEPIASFPLVRVEITVLFQGEQTLEDMTAVLEKRLGETLQVFLESTNWTTAVADIWQSLYVLALVGSNSDAVLASQLLNVLRVGQFMALLQDGNESLCLEEARNLVLNATPVFPDVVAASPLAPGVVVTARDGTVVSWEVLGVGTLKKTRQQLAAYLPGGLADVVNVMPRERQERQEHSLTRQEEHSHETQMQEQQRGHEKQSSDASELSDAVQEVMAAEGIVRNLSNIKPAYQNLNEILSGSWAGGNGGTGWTGIDASRLAQQLTEKAVQHLGDRVSRQRGQVWQELREQRHSNLIDNTGNDRLVGVYRWVDKLMRLHMENAGRRLVLAFLLDTPAQAWVNSLITAGALPLQKPVPLAAFSVADGQGYADITPANYQSFAAQYGDGDLPPPPEPTLNIVATVNRVVVGDLSQLCIPPGYIAASGQATIAMADNRYNLVCAIAGQDIPFPAGTSTVTPLTVIVPAASAATSVGNAVVTPPATLVSAVSTTTLTGISKASGAIAVTVMSAAPLFGVTVSLSCTRGLADGSDPLLVAWQRQCYERLLQAWQSAQQRYDEELARRIRLASAGHTTEVQRESLRQECLDMLLPAATDFRTLDPLFSWQDMSWHYEPWPVATSNPWPRILATSVSQAAGERQFQRFLQAPSAQVLLPVMPGRETWLLFLLQFPQAWIGDIASTPITESTLMLLEEILGPEPVQDRDQSRKTWTLRLPTSLLYLQKGQELPQIVPDTGLKDTL
jgi:hypothetical protein